MVALRARPRRVRAVSYARELLGRPRGAARRWGSRSTRPAASREPSPGRSTQLGKLDWSHRPARPGRGAVPRGARVLSRLRLRARAARARRGGAGRPAARDRAGAPRGRRACRCRSTSRRSATSTRGAGSPRRRAAVRADRRHRPAAAANGVRPTSRPRSSTPTTASACGGARSWRARASARARASTATTCSPWALARNGRCTEALPYSKRALRLGTRDALKFFHRGMIERCLGHRAARAWFRRALALNPDFSLLWAPVARRLRAMRRLAFLALALARGARRCRRSRPRTRSGNFTINHFSRDRARPATASTCSTCSTWPRSRRSRSAEPDGGHELLARRIVRGLVAAVDGPPFALRPRSSTRSRSRRAPPGCGRRGSRPCYAAAPSAPGPIASSYHDTNFPGRIGWREVVVRATRGQRPVDLDAPARAVSDELRAYPKDLLSEPARRALRDARGRPGTGSGAPPALGRQGARLGVTVRRAAMAVREPDRQGEPDAGVVALALALALFWGAAHALTPGPRQGDRRRLPHRTRGTPRHAAASALIVTVTHTDRRLRARAGDARALAVHRPRAALPVAQPRRRRCSSSRRLRRRCAPRVYAPGATHAHGHHHHHHQATATTTASELRPGAACSARRRSPAASCPARPRSSSSSRRSRCTGSATGCPDRRFQRRASPSRRRDRTRGRPREAAFSASASFEGRVVRLLPAVSALSSSSSVSAMTVRALPRVELTCSDSTTGSPRSRTAATLLVVAGVAVLLGLRHATDPDHLAAVTTLVARQGTGHARAAALGLAGGRPRDDAVRSRPADRPLQGVPARARQEGAETAIGS